MLIALDTNVLVRVFIDDSLSSKQVEEARQLAKQASNIFVPQIVQAELVWVLSFAYKLKKAQILVILEHLHTHSVFILQSPSRFVEALDLYQRGSADFADYLIMVEAKHAQAELFSFDKSLVKSGANAPS